MKKLDYSKFPYRSVFAADYKVIEPTENNKKLLSTAVVENLKDLLPQVKEEDVDLVPIVFSAFVSGMVNKNDDSIDKQTAIAIHNNFKNKFIDLEHDRDHIIGCILTAGFSKYGSEEIMTLKEVEATEEPFNVVLGGVIWPIVNEKVVENIVDSSDPDSEYYNAISASWELLFSEFKLVLLPEGETEISKGEIIEPNTEAVAALRANGGTGKVDDKRVYRLVQGDVVPLGIGLTQNPAADVKGLHSPQVELTEDDIAESAAKAVDLNNDNMIEIPEDQFAAIAEDIENNRKNERRVVLGFTVSELGKTDVQELFANLLKQRIDSKQNEKNTQSTEKSVITDKATKAKQEKTKHNNMKINSYKDITNEMLEAKEIQADQIHDCLVSEIKKASEDYVAQEAALKADAETQAQAAQEAKQQLEQIKEQSEKLQAELDSIKAAEEKRVKQELFNSRMSFFEDKYDLDDPTRAILAKRLGNIEADEQFTEFQSEFETLAGSKTKQVKQVKEGEEETKETVASATDDKVEVLDKALENGEESTAKVPNTSSSETETDFDKYAKGFGLDTFSLTNK